MSALLAPSRFKPPLLGKVRLAQGFDPSMFPGASGMPPAQTAAGQLAQNGAILNVQVASPNGGTPVTVQAMIDTGASISTMNSTIAQNAGLQQTGETQLGGVGGIQTSAIYAAALTLPDYGVSVNPIQVATVPGGLPGVDMLIGRDILENLVLNYDGSQGAFTLTQGTGAPQTPTTENQVAAAPPTPGTVPQPGQPAQGPLPQPPKSSNPWPWIAGGAAVVGLGIGALYLFKVL